MQAKIINNVRFENAKHQSQVREALEKAISNCIKNFAKNGWKPDAEEKFWSSIEKIVSENPENRKVYRQYEDLQFLYQYAENWYYSYPSNLTMQRSKDLIQIMNKNILQCFSPVMQKDCRCFWMTIKSAIKMINKSIISIVKMKKQMLLQNGSKKYLCKR